MDESASPITGRGQPAEFPAGLNNAFVFAVFNALSYQVVLNSPMVLYAKSLGASATVLGIVAGMMPLLVIFQIPAAGYIPRVGYKRFLYAGWGTRVMFIFGMALVPLSGFVLDANNRLALLMMLLFGFNLSRGISSCAWLPWLTELLPPTLRGKYLVREAAVTNLASFFTFLIAAVCLSGRTQQWQFALVFGFSAVMGAASLTFLKRIPDASIPEDIRTSKTRVPWMEIISHPPFKKLLAMVMAWSVAYGGVVAFTVSYLKTEAGMSEGRILLATSVAFLGGLSSLWLVGSRLDRLGSKPVLTTSFAAWFVVLGGWLLLAGGAVRLQVVLMLALQFCMGLFAAVVQMSNTRLAMVVIPPMGRNHFFAAFSVVNNVTLGLSPIAWGLLIDLVGNRTISWGGLVWTRYAVFFAGAMVVFAAAFVCARRLEEREAASMETLLKDLLVHAPHRAWVRLWPRS